MLSIRLLKLTRIDNTLTILKIVPKNGNQFPFYFMNQLLNINYRSPDGE
jgi:hypothetical protein